MGFWGAKTFTWSPGVGALGTGPKKKKKKQTHNPVPGGAQTSGELKIKCHLTPNQLFPPLVPPKGFPVVDCSQGGVVICCFFCFSKGENKKTGWVGGGGGIRTKKRGKKWDNPKIFFLFFGGAGGGGPPGGGGGTQKFLLNGGVRQRAQEGKGPKKPGVADFSPLKKTGGASLFKTPPGGGGRKKKGKIFGLFWMGRVSNLRGGPTHGGTVKNFDQKKRGGGGTKHPGGGGGGGGGTFP